MNVVKHESLLHAGEYSGYMARIAMTGSSGSVTPNFLRNRQTDFQSSCTILYSHQQWRSDPLSPHPRQHLLSLEFSFLSFYFLYSLFALQRLSSFPVPPHHMSHKSSSLCPFQITSTTIFCSDILLQNWIQIFQDQGPLLPSFLEIF